MPACHIFTYIYKAIWSICLENDIFIPQAFLATIQDVLLINKKRQSLSGLEHEWIS